MDAAVEMGNSKTYNMIVLELPILGMKPVVDVDAVLRGDLKDPLPETPPPPDTTSTSRVSMRH